jgi:uncharacterized protein (DUF433 family)
MSFAMATAAKLVYPHISKDPAVCGGSACVEGTRIRVIDIVAAYKDGKDPEAIVDEYTALKDTSDVFAALVYYYDHKDEIEADIAEGERLEQQAELERVESLKRRR